MSSIIGKKDIGFKPFEQRQQTINVTIYTEQKRALRNESRTYWSSNVHDVNIPKDSVILSWEDMPHAAFSLFNNLDHRGNTIEEMYQKLNIRGVSSTTEDNGVKGVPPSHGVAGQGDPVLDVRNDDEYWFQGDKLMWCIPDENTYNIPQGVVFKKYKPLTTEEIYEELLLINQNGSKYDYITPVDELYRYIELQSDTVQDILRESAIDQKKKKPAFTIDNDLKKESMDVILKNSMFKSHTKKILGLIERVKNHEKRRIIGRAVNDIKKGQRGAVLITFFR